MTRIFITTLLLMAAFLLFPGSVSAREVKVQVAVTADVHARLFPYDFVANRPARTSMANVHYMVQSLRARERSNLILLDNGDLIQGTPAAYYANFVQETDENLFSRMMNFIGYDAATIGNHDIEAGPEVYNRILDEFDFPWLGGNVLDAETGEPYFKPYIIIERQRVKVAVIGLTTTGVPNWLPPHLWEGLEFQDMVESAQYWVDYINENEEADAIIGLFHSGFGPLEPDPDDHPLENASGYIAKHVHGFDVIFSSHDHRRRIQTVSNTAGEDVLVMGPGHFAEHLALTELTFRRESRREPFQLKDVRAEMISTEKAVPSHPFIQKFEDDVQEILDFANKEVGKITADIHSMESLFGSAPFTDLVHHVQLSLTEADISFTAPLAFDQTIRKGKLHMRDFFRLYEYENYLYTMELTGQEIIDHLEYSYGLWFNRMLNEDDHLLNMRRDELGRIPGDRKGRQALRNAPYNFDSAAGIEYTVDVSKAVGERVEILGMEDGSSFDPESTYQVAINSYRGSGGGGHLTEGAGISRDELSERISFTTERDLRSYMIDYFSEIEEYHPESRNNWKVIPEEWAEQGRKKDMPYLRR